MRQAALLLALLLIPLGHAAPLHLEVPDQISFADGFLMAGHITGLPAIEAPVLVEPSNVQFGSGTLTVCPVDGGGDILEAIAQLRNQCDQEQTFENPLIEFAPGSALRMDGAYDAPPEQPASLVAFDAENHWAVLGSQELELSNADGFAFVPITAKSMVTVTTKDGAQTFTGRDYFFHHESATAAWDVAGYAAIGATPGITLSAAKSSDFQHIGDPFLLLDLQEGLLGADARERRSDLAAIVNHFGRIPDLVNGALYGHLNGTIGEHAMSPGKVAAIRVSDASLRITDGALIGDADALLIVRDGSVSSGGRAWQPAWWLGAALWIGAIAVSAVRRYPVSARGVMPWIGLGVGAVSFLVIDLFVYWRLAGTGALPSLLRGDRFPVLMDVAGISIVTAIVSWVVFLVPARHVVRKFSSPRWAWIGDAASYALFLLILFVSPAAMLAGANDILRF